MIDAVNQLTELTNELQVRCGEIAALQKTCSHLKDENSKLGLQYEKLLREKSDLELDMARLEGQVEAFRFIWGCRK